jgi:hypothetical protein
MSKKLALLFTLFMIFPFVSLAADHGVYSVSSLVGEWVCTKYRNVAPANIRPHPSYYKLSNNRLFVHMEHLRLIITKDPDGTVRWSSGPRNAFAGIYAVLDPFGQPTGRGSDECPSDGIMESFHGSHAVSSPN